MFPIKHSVHHRAITGLQAVNPQVSPKGIPKNTEPCPRHSTPKASLKGTRKGTPKPSPFPSPSNPWSPSPSIPGPTPRGDHSTPNGIPQPQGFGSQLGISKHTKAFYSQGHPPRVCASTLLTLKLLKTQKTPIFESSKDPKNPKIPKNPKHYHHTQT